MPIHTIETFNVQHLSILDEKGVVDPEFEPELPDEDLLRLHRYMTFSRMADARMLNLQRQGRLGTLPACTGQEASFCAPCLAIKDTDWFVGSYRELGARLMRGDPLENLLHAFNGFEDGGSATKNQRTLPISIILASQLPHAVGLAYGSRLRGEENTVALVMFGDGASSEGDFHEALNFAGVLNAPVIFLCQNNQYAISTPRNIQSRSATIAQKAIAYGMPGIQVDGNDPLAVFKAVSEAVARARNNEGPSLIETFTFRMLMHTTADDPTRYREEKEVKEWKQRDPLIRFKIYLINKKIWDGEKQEQLEQELKTTIDETVKLFESKKDFKPDAPFDYVFETPTTLLEEQRSEFLSYLQEKLKNG
jgi:pyruvate dehydrogenase E1 component alpha subunit